MFSSFFAEFCPVAAGRWLLHPQATISAPSVIIRFTRCGHCSVEVPSKVSCWLNGPSERSNMKYLPLAVTWGDRVLRHLSLSRLNYPCVAGFLGEGGE